MKLLSFYFIGIVFWVFSLYALIVDPSLFHRALCFSSLGYVFLADSILYSIRRKSLLMEHFGTFIAYGFLSFAYWRLLKLFDEVSDTWQEPIASLSYSLLSSGNEAWEYLKDTTYFPVMLTSISFFLYTFPRPQKSLSMRGALAYFLIGLLLLALYFVYHQELFFLLWLFPIFFIDPWNWKRGSFSCFSCIVDKRMGPLIRVGLGGIVAGLFWEGLNMLDVKGWSYQLPYLNGLYLFKMPLLGYLGYAVFGMTIVSFITFIKGCFSSLAEDSLL